VHAELSDGQTSPFTTALEASGLLLPREVTRVIV